MELTKNQIKELKDKKFRKNNNLFFVEGEKFCHDLLSADVQILYTITTNKNLKGFPNVYVVDEKTLNSLATTVTPQNVICVCVKKFVKNKPNGNSLILDRIQDPGNVGTLIRSALAFGFNDVYLIDSADAYNEKVIRSSVGAVLSTNIHKISLEDLIKEKREIAENFIVADMVGEKLKDFKKKKGRIALIVGNEGAGVCDELINISNIKLSIPMTNKIESLNAGVAGSIIMQKIFEN
ncbi:MAG TPA: RNA methyltransferase [Candidatus Onthoplasma faecipullorum]|nr:RNA methyltransferase [Candidatus Onthoplasma faecipullorum]